MSSFDWEKFLRRWGEAVLESMSADQLATLPQNVIETGWLGYPGATEAQICQTESRLGVKFPPSYREFLKVTNGWRQTTPFIHKLWSTEAIERFSVRHQKWIEAFVNQHENTQICFEDAIELDELWEPSTIVDEEYLIYGDDQDCSKLRVEYLKPAIEISDVGEAAIYLLNPQVVTADGEWEAWFFCDWLPGADRYRSFQEMMEAEYYNFLELRETPPAQQESCMESAAIGVADSLAASTQKTQVAETLTPETSSPLVTAVIEEHPAEWRSLRRLIVEFQTRQAGEQLEYQTVVTAEGEQRSTWSGFGEQKLRKWLQEQLTEEIQRSVTPMTASGSETTMTSPETAACVPPKPPQPSRNVTVRIDQLAIRQDSHVAAPIIVCPAMLEQTQQTSHASLTSQQPFSLEVTFHLTGQRLSDFPAQSVTYHTQVHAQNRTTGQWIALGETRPHVLSSDQQTYTDHLFGNSLASGMYRLQVLTTLRGAAVALASFELPLLNVV